MRSRSITLKQIKAINNTHVPPRHGMRIVAIFLILELLLLLSLSLIFSNGALAAGISGDLRVQTNDGYLRLAFRFAEEVEADVRVSNNILVIAFKKPVDVAVDRISVSSASYVAAARRDPDGGAIRLALTRKVTVNTMAAGERLFVDVLPENWSGLPPGLPQEVIDELAARAREAEKRARQQQQLVDQQRQASPLRVRVAQQPTFTRYVFDLTDPVPVSADRGKDNLTILFDSPLKFDLADAKAALPPTIASIEAIRGQDTSSVRFAFIGNVDVRTFRENNSYIVDVVTPEAKGRRPESPQSALPEGELPAVNLVPADDAGEAKRKDGRAAASKQPPSAKPPEVTSPSTTASRAPPTVVKPPDESLKSTEEAGQNRVTRKETAPAPPIEKPAPQKDADPLKVVASQFSGPPPVADLMDKSKPSAEAPSTSRVDAGDEVALKSRDPTAPVKVELRHVGDSLRLTFPFAVQTPAAVFRRFDTLWFVFDTPVQIDVGSLIGPSVQVIRGAEVVRVGDSQIVRVKLDRPKLASLGGEGTAWTVTLGDMVLEPARPLSVIRNVSGVARANVTIPFDEPQRLHRIADPNIGDTLFVVTALGPARGFLKAQDFVEFRALASNHGIVIQPLADELTMDMSNDKVVVSRPGGLALSAIESTNLAGQQARRAGSFRQVLFDNQIWGFNRQADFRQQVDTLTRAAAEAPQPKRALARLDLARFYLSRDMYPEAKSVLDIAIADDRVTADDPSALVLRSIASIMIGRPIDALNDLSNPAVGNQQEAPLWRGLAFMRQGKWVEAREAFKAGEAAIATLPVELQRIAMTEVTRAAIGVRDFGEAARLLGEFDALGVPRELEATIAVLKGRLDEGLGRVSDALGHYRTAADSWDRPAASEAQLREIILSQSIGELKRPDAITKLEGLTTVWRGDETEVEALQLLARLYTEEGRYRDAFQVMRTALKAHPNSEMTRRIHDEAAATFDVLFLAGKGDAMPAIDALSLFYDFSELTPVGRRGDEMIRRLADRLVSIDLLNEGAELLQHQVDHRLQGVARAQVAVRLAVIYLMNRKPDRALQVMRTTRTAELTNELRTQRLLIEARALSDTGRHDLALEVIADMDGREVDRLRADILWAARRWGQSAEHIEKLYGDRWREFAPLNDPERADIMRAAVGYALSEDALGLDRFRQRYAAKMSETPDQRAFDVLTTPIRAGTTEFGDVAKVAGAVNTLEGFLRDMRVRYPDFGAAPPAQPSPPPGSQS